MDKPMEDWMEWNDRANFLLFMYKAAMPGGGINDLKGVVHCREAAMRIVLSKYDHPYVVQLVDINTYVADALFDSSYRDIISEYRKKNGHYFSSSENINISEYETIIISSLRTKDEKTIQDALE